MPFYAPWLFFKMIRYQALPLFSCALKESGIEPGNKASHRYRTGGTSVGSRPDPHPSNTLVPLTIAKSCRKR